MKKQGFLLALAFAAIIAVSLFTGCAKQPYDKPEYKDIPSNCTAFLIPTNGKTASQAQFMSEDYLRDNKVAKTSVQINHEWVKTGKKANDGYYRALETLVLVDRTPYSVTWTKYVGNGNTDSDLNPLRIAVESKESVGFTIPISLTASITEPDAVSFLYKYTEGRTLKSVVDTDVNSYIKTRAAAKFGSLTLTECKSTKQAVLDAIFTDATAYFKQFGITLGQFGMTDGFYYDDEKYQAEINRSMLLDLEGKNLATVEANAEKQRQIDFKNAANKTRIANEQAQAAPAMMRLQEIENSKIIAEAQAEAIVEFAKNATLPNILPESTFYQLGLDKLVPTAKSNGK